jgi:hypothetical protein
MSKSMKFKKSSTAVKSEENPEKCTRKELKIGFLLRKCMYSESFVPEIRLNGKWLEVAGFKAGKKVKIEYRDGEIVLTI